MPPKPVPESTFTKVMDATLQVLTEYGYADTTVERISSVSGCAKTTIYRWWTSKAAIVLDLFKREVVATFQIPDTGDVEGDLVAFLHCLKGQLVGSVLGKAMAALSVEARDDPVMHETLCTRFQAFHRDPLRHILERASDNGKLPAGLDLETVVDLIVGPMLYRLQVIHEPIPDGYPENIVRSMLEGVLVNKR